MNDKVAAGIDIGGTKIALALGNQEGEILAARRLPTRVELGPEKILENISTCLEEMLTETGTNLGAVGIGCPGPIDIERGLVLSPANLPDWDGFPLVELFEKKFNVPVVFENDANAAALGEYFYGAGRGFKNIFYITVSTGIGGAIIQNGEVIHGIAAGAGEIGHTIVKPGGVLCGCGNFGCLETISSGRSIVRRTREKLAQRNSSEINKMVQSLDEITTEIIVEAVKKGDELACSIWDETSNFLAIGIGNAITLIAPEAVIIGGGVASAGEVFFEPLNSLLRQNVKMLPMEKVSVLPAVLGADNGVCGALILARQAFGNS